MSLLDMNFSFWTKKEKEEKGSLTLSVRDRKERKERNRNSVSLKSVFVAISSHKIKSHTFRSLSIQELMTSLLSADFVELVSPKRFLVLVRWTPSPCFAD